MANVPQVIDLFAGVGGLSLSAERAGFKVAAAVEREKRIIDSHAKNFPNSVHISADVATLDYKDLRRKAGLAQTELAGLVGGPPCQGFSSMGKRSTGDHRNRLFVDFFKLASALQPGFFVAENVPGILHEKYSRLISRATDIVEDQYDMLEPIKLAANELGAATTRTRVFFIGVRKDLTGANLIKNAINDLKVTTQLSVRDALAGLPKTISETWDDFDSSWRKVESASFTNYVHCLNEMKSGIGDKDSIRRFEKSHEVSGCFGTRHTKPVVKRFSKLKPGEVDSVSKAVKLKSDGLCPTLRAGTDNTRGSFQAVRPIHPSQSRVITPREAARLQGFPDWFQFHETKWHSFRQIGNSVCPVMGEKILSAIKTSLSM